MNYHSDEWIMDRLQEHYEEALTIFPKDKTISICNTVRDCNKIFYNFVIGKALDSLIIGIISFILISHFMIWETDKECR